jgi:hypothetical protein
LGFKNHASIEAIEMGESFPKEEKLAVIARAYDLNLEEVTQAFNISKEARNKEKQGRRKHKPKFHKETDVFPVDTVSFHRKSYHPPLDDDK